MIVLDSLQDANYMYTGARHELLSSHHMYNVTNLYYKIHPLPAKTKNKKKIPRISEFVNFF